MTQPAGVGRVTVITNGNVFAARALAPLIERSGEAIALQMIVTTGLRKQRGNRVGEALHLLSRWGLRYFLYKSATYAIPAAAEFCGRGPRTVAGLCKRAGLPIQVARNVNHRSVRQAVDLFAPDIILSVSCPYRIKKRLLDVARLGCLNLHSSLLPAYAGVCTYIHVLAAGEERTGVTLHEMVEEFDAGRIIAQEPLEIRPGVSVCCLFGELCRAAGPMVADEISRIFERGEIGGRDQDRNGRHYCGEPTREDIAALRRGGFPLLDLADVRVLWSQEPGTSSS